ncbi:MAG TPA: phosphoribosylanthranilate isomerase, partial [Vicinamibacterales bacterium]|nr:phosphoribosylanthranilate isomerase [Vicinamibacterales bacterium]
TLVDAADVIRRGGTGERANWALAAALAARRPVMLAGGLRPENVVEAMHAVRPFAIDVSSGVEAEPGVKDAARMRSLFAAIRAGEGVTS